MYFLYFFNQDCEDAFVHEEWVSAYHPGLDMAAVARGTCHNNHVISVFHYINMTRFMTNKIGS